MPRGPSPGADGAAAPGSRRPERAARPAAVGSRGRPRRRERGGRPIFLPVLTGGRLGGASPWKSAEHAQDGDGGADDGGEDHAGLREHGAGEPPCQAGLQLGEPGRELVGRHVVSVVGCLSDGGRDGVGELRVGAGVGQGAGDSVGIESGHASEPSPSSLAPPDRRHDLRALAEQSEQARGQLHPNEYGAFPGNRHLHP